MRKFFFLFFVAILFSSCENPTQKTEETPVVENPAPNEPEEPATPDIGEFVVRNSAWEKVDGGALLSMMRAAGEVPASIEAFVEEYNASHTDDQLHLLTEDVPIEEAPACTITMVDATTYEVKTNSITGDPYVLTMDREDVEGRREAWRLECINVGNGKLYVDQPPPAPIVITPPTEEELYARYSIYVIDPAQNGKIIWEVHCTEWEAMGYESLEYCYYYKRQAAYYDTLGTGYVMIEGYIYTEPE